VIVLPEKHFEADELELIFRHELTHYQRHDLLVKLLAVIAVSIHWFNPMVYLMYAMMQADSEASCDEAVLRDIGVENRQFYAELIMEMICGGNTARTMMSTCFYGGRRSIKRRLDAILNTTGKMKNSAYAVFTTFTLLTVFSGSVFAFNMPLPPGEPFIETAAGISPAKAKEAALAAVGGGTVGRTETKYNREGRIAHYKVIIARDDNMYDVDVTARDGTVMNMRMERITKTVANVADVTGTIGADKAKAIATDNAGGGVVVMCCLEKKPIENILIYHVHVANNERWEYCVEIDAATGYIYRTEARHKP